jgi:hypothetical protein
MIISLQTWSTDNAKHQPGSVGSHVAHTAINKDSTCHAGCNILVRHMR